MGYFRLFLALVVMWSHTLPRGNQDALAHVAVLLFAVLSGYGCTKAMQGPYRGRPLTFLWNRYLRLWPGYLAVFGLSSIAWLIWPELPGIGFPQGGRWGLELMMLSRYAQLIPPAWMMPFLWLGYAVIALGFSSTATRSLVWLGISFAWSQHQSMMLGWFAYYGSFAAWSLAYAAGASMAWMPAEIPPSKGLASDLAFPVFLCHYLVLAINGMGYPKVGPYSSPPLAPH